MKSSKARILALCLLTTVTLVGCSELAKPTSARIADTQEPAYQEPAEEEPAAVTYDVPKRADFKLNLKILSKHCFGSAGCNVTYRIHAAFATVTNYDPDHEYTLVYEVRGGEDGPQRNSFTFQGENASLDSEEFISTRSSKAKLSVVVMEILP